MLPISKFLSKKELESIEKAKVRNQKDPYKYIGNLRYFNEEDLRFSTPEKVANLRAKRLKCKRIVDLCSGIGVQAFAFSKTCSEVLAVELDQRKVVYSKENFIRIKNIEFVHGDVLSDKVIQMVKEFKPDVIFCDPERLNEEKERDLKTIKPNLKKIVDIYSKICKNICLEVPPRIDLEKLKELGEFGVEYLSWNNRLNRLDLYFGDLKEGDVFVIDISGEILEKKKKIKLEFSDKPLDYIYEVSEGVLMAGLENEICEFVGGKLLLKEKNKLLITSEILKKNSFSNCYKILGMFEDVDSCNKFLKEKEFGKVVLKYSIDPKEYWNERRDFESRLFGEKEAVVFKVRGKFLVCC
jgi:16S rRNA G966 N2-methylase RsmD